MSAAQNHIKLYSKSILLIDLDDTIFSKKEVNEHMKVQITSKHQNNQKCPFILIS